MGSNKITRNSLRGKNKSSDSFRNLFVYVGCFAVTLMLFTMLIIPVWDDRSGLEIIQEFLDSDSSENIVSVGDPPFNSTDNLGYELLDNGSVFHMWNNYDDYYFNRSNGVQFSNHYQEYWTTNVLMLGYYAGDTWNLLYRVDELSGFTEVLDCVTDDYINVTLWKDLSYGSYDFRLALRYHLKVNDSDLTIIPYIKNLGVNIPFDVGFGWEMKDINIANVTNDNYLWIGNNTVTEKILLNQTLDRSWNDLENNTKINLVCNNPPSKHLSRNLYLTWNKNLTYKVICESRVNQYNAPTTLFIEVGTLTVDQEKFTVMNWLDADDWLGISSTEYDSHCGDDGSHTLEEALDGTDYWYHDTGEIHWFILDLGQSYTISEVRGRSITNFDPTDVNIYIDDSNPPTTLCEEGISSWVGVSNWVEIVLTSEGTGRYIKVEVEDTELIQWIQWGQAGSPYTIFDAYGDVAGGAAWSNTNPVNSNPNPANGSTGVDLNPSNFSIKVTDLNDGNQSMNLTFRTNASGTWKDCQTNQSTLINDTFYNLNTSWITAYDTKYWWSVNTSDNHSTRGWDNDTYSFTTESWTTVNNTINGGYTNTTLWHTIDDTYNGVYTNTTLWHTINNTINGVYTNTTSWYIVNNTISGVYNNNTVRTWQNVNTTINGSYSNTTSWLTINNTINGSYTNETSWYIINNTINGSYSNTTNWFTINNSINGTYSNTTLWHSINISINGTYTNETSWYVINNTINGSYSNVSGVTWQVINNTVNGAYSNTTNWFTVNDTINGIYSNTTLWHTVDDAYNGAYSNATLWHTVNNTINGVYTNTTNDSPTVTNEIPANKSKNVSITTNMLQVDMNDSEGDMFDWSWNCSDGSGNSAIGNTNGTKYFWLLFGDLTYGTNYTWWVNVTDGTDVTNMTFWFITENWQTINNTINGTYINTTIWVVVNNTINGAYSNTTSWYTINNTINGAYSNTTLWHTVDATINGTYTNGSRWTTVNSTINGSYTNTSAVAPVVPAGGGGVVPPPDVVIDEPVVERPGFVDLLIGWLRQINPLIILVLAIIFCFVFVTRRKKKYRYYRTKRSSEKPKSPIQRKPDKYDPPYRLP